MATLAAARAEQRYRRLLRSYPAAWRTRHGEVLLGVLLDRAEAEARTAPTVRESIDLVRQGLWTRLVSGDSLELRRRIASVSVGIGFGFAAIYTALGLLPSHWPGPQSLTVQPGPLLNLVAWALLGIVAVVRLPPIFRVAPQLAVLVAPTLVRSPSFEVEGAGKYLPLNGWVLGNDANATFLLVLAVLSAVGPLSRRLLLRSSVIGTLAVAAAFLVSAGGWSDPYNQTLWAATDRYSTPVPGTLDALWHRDTGRMPLPTSTPPPDQVILEWVRWTFLQLNLLPLAVIAAAVGAGAVLRRVGRRVAGSTVLLLACPVLAAVLVAAFRPTGVWFQ